MKGRVVLRLPKLAIKWCSVIIKLAQEILRGYKERENETRIKFIGHTICGNVCLHTYMIYRCSEQTFNPSK